jgi:hypothetical protein
MAVFTEDLGDRVVRDAARSLVTEFGPILGEATVMREIEAAYRSFGPVSTQAYLPLLTHRKARERLLGMTRRV